MAVKEYKRVDLPEYEIVEDENSWTIKGWAATYDWDRGADKIVPGAMQDSVKKRHQDRIAAGKVSEVKFLWNHDEVKIIGTPMVMFEDTSKGLWVEAKFIKDDDFPEARRAYKLAKMGLLVSFSIGYITLESKPKVKVKGQPRLLKKIDVVEFSLVAIPMNEFADVEEVKALDDTITKDQPEEEIEMSEAEFKSLVDQLVDAVRGAVLEALTPPVEVDKEVEAAVEEPVAEETETKEEVVVGTDAGIVVETQAVVEEVKAEEVKAAASDAVAAALQALAEKMDLLLTAVLKDAADDASEEDMACAANHKSTETESPEEAVPAVEVKSQDEENDLEIKKGFLESLRELQATFQKDKV